MDHPELVGDLITREDQLMSRQSPYPPELRRRAVRMVDEVRDQYDTEFAAITAAAKKREYVQSARAGVPDRRRTGRHRGDRGLHDPVRPGADPPMAGPVTCG